MVIVPNYCKPRAVAHWSGSHRSSLQVFKIDWTKWTCSYMMAPQKRTVDLPNTPWLGMVRATTMVQLAFHASNSYLLVIFFGIRIGISTLMRSVNPWTHGCNDKHCTIVATVYFHSHRCINCSQDACVCVCLCGCVYRQQMNCFYCSWKTGSVSHVAAFSGHALDGHKTRAFAEYTDGYDDLVDN